MFEIKDLSEYMSQLMSKDNSDKLIIAYFTATWCGPCKMIAPLMYEIDEQNDHIIVMKVDVDECEEVSAQCDIECMPTFLFYQNNEIEPFNKFSGADPQKLVTTINNILNQ